MDAKQAAKIALGAYIGYAVLRKLVQGDQFAPVTLPPVRKDSPKCLVVGCGISGICMSIKLAQKGIDHIVVEKESDVGGTWFLSNYPGVQCDVPSHGYCFSFEMNADWSQAYATSKEIWRYLSNVAKKYGVYNRTKFNTEVSSARWNEVDRKWTVEIAGKDGKTETHVVDYLISGIGALHFPQYPNVPGIGKLKGREIHSAEWRDDIDCKGKNVVVVGSAASAVQIVPSVAEVAKSVTCIQRTPNWLAPQKSPVLPLSLKYSSFVRWCFRNLPGALLLHRFLIYCTMEGIHFPLGLFSGGSEGSGQLIAKKVLTKYMMHQLKGNTELAEKVIPKYAVGCKRIIRSERFLPALLKDHVELVTDALAKVDETGVVIKTSKGEERHIDADVLVYATGYQVGSLGRLQLRGCNDHLLTGMDMIDQAVDSYYGICNPDYPNAFLLLGPNTGLGHNSIIIMIETQADFIARTIELAIDAKVNRIAVKPEAVDRCMKYINETMDTSVWKDGKCNSWYQNKDGKVPTIWPGTTMKYMGDLVPPNDLSLFDCLTKGTARHEVSKM